MENYIKLHSRLPFSSFYIFVDTIDRIYERIMEQHGISLKGVREYKKAESDFRLVTCHVRKRDESLFCNAIRQVRNNAFLLGYRDYDDMCLALQNSVKKPDTIDPACP